jgi:7-cyano-7-deazaguanine synthase in queuosine biosynthesis
LITQRFPFTTSFSTASQDSARKLRAGEHFRFDLEAVNNFCLGDLPARLVDFLRVTSSFYVVDRLVKRRATGGARKPSRTIGLNVAMLDAAFWGQREVRDAIHETVEFVSGDFWDIEFLQDTSPFCRANRFLLPDPYEGVSPLVCLYSGGLDSAAGLVARMVESPGRPVLPVTVWHQPRQRHLVHEQLKILRGRFDVAVDPLIVKVAIMWKPLLDRDLEESTQRCRCFLFASLGAIAAIMHGQRVVEVFESGVGAINLPPMAGMVGAMTTKSAHPKFLRLMSRLASLVAGGEVEFRLPFFDRTKGELVRTMAEAGLEELALRTASCVKYPLRHSRQKQCGVCPACVFRRQAMAVAGITEPEDTYKYDFMGSPGVVSRIPSKRLLHLKAFLMQVASLRDVCAGKPLPHSVARHLVSTEVLADGHSREVATALLARYRDEWVEIASDGNRKGLPWARLLAAPRPQKQGVTHASA